MLDVMNTLGLSNTVMRLIEKRSAQVGVVLFVCVRVCMHVCVVSAVCSLVFSMSIFVTH